MIAEGGVDSITHRRVAERAGIPLGSTTYYFDSREHLLREAFARYIESTRRELESDLAVYPIDTRADLVAAMLRWVRREFEDQTLLKAEYEMILYASRDAEIARALAEWDASMSAILATHLARLGVARPEVAAQVLLHFVRGFEVTGLSVAADADERGLAASLERLSVALIGSIPA